MAGQGQLKVQGRIPAAGSLVVPPLIEVPVVPPPIYSLLIQTPPHMRRRRPRVSDPKGQPIGASKSLRGVHASNKRALHDAVANGTIEVWKPSSSRGRVAIPDAFDSETNWPKCAKVIGDIRDQSACGCCWAFGAAEAASDRLCIATNGTVAVPLSAQATCFCAQDQGCNGGQLQTAWSFISNEGVVTGGQVRASCKVSPPRGSRTH